MVYELTFDENGLLDFTQKNIDLIETCISIDSRYRRAFDVTNEEGSAWFIKNNLDFNNEHNRCVLFARKHFHDGFCDSKSKHALLLVGWDST